MATRYGIIMTRAPEAGLPLGRVETPRLVYAVIAVCTAAAAFLRFYQLTRPGYLLGVTEYDDGPCLCVQWTLWLRITDKGKAISRSYEPEYEKWLEDLRAHDREFEALPLTLEPGGAGRVA